MGPAGRTDFDLDPPDVTVHVPCRSNNLLGNWHLGPLGENPSKRGRVDRLTPPGFSLQPVVRVFGEPPCLEVIRRFRGLDDEAVGGPCASCGHSCFNTRHCAAGTGASCGVPTWRAAPGTPSGSQDRTQDEGRKRPDRQRMAANPQGSRPFRSTWRPL
jgi:hypothetical protein